MTVKCINELQKEVLASSFANKQLTLEDLMATTGRSRRTIMRMLEEAGVAPAVRKRKAKENTASQTDTQGVYFPKKLNWFDRFIQSIARSFSFLR